MQGSSERSKVAFKLKCKHKQPLQPSAWITADSPSGDGVGDGATRQDSRRQRPLPSSWHSPSPTTDEQKISRGHNDRDDHNIQHVGQTKLFVANISPYVQKHDLETAFGRYGSVQRVYLSSRHYGFVVFYHPQDADAARCHLNDKYFFGNCISVQFAKDDKTPRYDDRYDKLRYDCRYDHYGRHGGNTLYVSHISPHTRIHDLEDLFSKYGRLRKVDLNQKRRGFGFIEFSDPRDAYDARYGLDGRKLDGSHIVVEFAIGVPRGPGGVRQSGKGPPPGRCYNRGMDGHRVRDCKAGDRRDRCYRCGEMGHTERNCQNSPKDLERLRSNSRSPSPHHGKGRGRSYSRSPSARHGRGRNWSYSPHHSPNPRRNLPPREQAERNGSYHGGSPRKGEPRGNRGRQ